MDGWKRKKTVILSFTRTGTELNRKLCKLLGEKQCFGYAPEKYAKDVIKALPENRRDLIGADWGSAVFIFIGAAGIAVRYVAPWVKDKYTDSPVLVIDEQGNYVIPLLSGHIGGAAELADMTAELIHAAAVHTTATDVQGKFAVDVFAGKNHLMLTDRQAAKEISAAVLDGEKAALWIDSISSRIEIKGKIPEEIVLCKTSEEAKTYRCRIFIADHPDSRLLKTDRKDDVNLFLRPANIIAGIGCRKGIEPEFLEKEFLDILKTENLAAGQVKAIASISIKKNEKAIIRLAEKYRIPFITYSPEELSSIEEVSSRSEFVKKVTGVDNVCERAARMYCPDGLLIRGKCIRKGMTVALVRCPMEIIF